MPDRGGKIKIFRTYGTDSQGINVADAIRQIGVSDVTYYRWRQEFGGLTTVQIKRLKELETENARLRRAVSDLTLDKVILQEAAWGNFWAPHVAVSLEARPRGNASIFFQQQRR